MAWLSAISPCNIDGDTNCVAKGDRSAVVAGGAGAAGAVGAGATGAAGASAAGTACPALRTIDGKRSGMMVCRSVPPRTDTVIEPAGSWMEPALTGAWRTSTISASVSQVLEVLLQTDTRSPTENCSKGLTPAASVVGRLGMEQADEAAYWDLRSSWEMCSGLTHLVAVPPRKDTMTEPAERSTPPTFLALSSTSTTMPLVSQASKLLLQTSTWTPFFRPSSSPWAETVVVRRSLPGEAPWPPSTG
mmetsp:Transcript_27169/g.86316  ORF Transcript_27169/g.86316 Transcript_27169/m.86316 type:complete len:246 (-) Transcript_27169:261-998(-)